MANDHVIVEDIINDFIATDSNNDMTCLIYSNQEFYQQSV